MASIVSAYMRLMSFVEMSTIRVMIESRGIGALCRVADGVYQSAAERRELTSNPAESTE